MYRIEEITIINYAGIQDGMGTKKLYVDFKQVSSSIIVLAGGNGSGKSTFMRALSLLNDPSIEFVYGEVAEKKISVIDDRYNIRHIVHYISEPKIDKTTRECTWSTKGYIERENLLSGERTSLNPSGNITQCRNIVFDVFSLDPNFMSLTKLGSEDHGIISKTPAQRKLFLSKCINSLEVYNNMHKVLTKRSSIFKSMINSLVSKINSLGCDPTTLDSSLVSIEETINILMGRREARIAELASINEKLKNLDPTGDLTINYNDYNHQINILKVDNIAFSEELENFKTKNLPDVDVSLITRELVQECIMRAKSLEHEIDNISSNISTLNAQRASDFNILSGKKAKLESIQNDAHIEELNERMAKNSLEMENLKTTWRDLPMSEELSQSAVEKLSTFIIMIENIKKSDTYPLISLSNNTLLDLENEYRIVYNRINRIKEIIYDLQKNQESILKEIEVSKLSHQIPNNCNNKETCPFIKDIMDTIKRNPEEANAEITRRLSARTEELNTDLSILESFGEARKFMQDVNIIMAHVSSFAAINNANNSIILPNYNIDVVLNMIKNNTKFETAYNSLTNITHWNNACKEYNILKKMVDEDTILLAKCNGNSMLKDELIQDISHYEKVVNVADSSLKNLNDSLVITRKKLNDCSNNINMYSGYLMLYEKHMTIKTKIAELEREKDKLSGNIEAINNLRIDQDRVSSQITSITNELEPIIKDRDNIKHAIHLYKEYTVELSEFELKYQKAEVSKKYSSPTGKGIQTWFIDSYMGKILDIANQLLQIVFDGELILSPFVVNAEEFRIPCYSRGFLHEDVSRMSTSQRCMISLVVNFALIKHSGTDYNIVRLDEIDGGLDPENRARFIVLLNQLIEIIECRQCFIISHNNEMQLDNVAKLIFSRNNIIASEGIVVASAV